MSQGLTRHSHFSLDDRTEEESCTSVWIDRTAPYLVGRVQRRRRVSFASQLGVLLPSKTAMHNGDVSGLWLRNSANALTGTRQ
jgi:hypothetical protein